MDLILTALAPIIWGSTYIVTTELLPYGYPLMDAVLRALPAGIFLLLIVKKLPKGLWILRILMLGALNFSIFWAMLFVSAYKLPGGVAATLGATQPLMVLLIANLVLKTSIRPLAIAASIVGLMGVGLLVLTPEAKLNSIGILSAFTAALSMAIGTVFTRKWKPPVSALTYTAWQLTAGGLLLLPIALYKEPNFPLPTVTNLVGFIWLGLFGAALTYYLWFRGIDRLGPARATALSFSSPVSAVLLGWVILHQQLNIYQVSGILIILGSTWGIQKMAA